MADEIKQTQGIIISNYTYDILAESAYNSFNNFRVILLNELDKDAYDCLCKYSIYDASDLTINCNIAKYELSQNTNFEGNPCSAGNNYPTGGWPLSNVQLYKNSGKCLYGIVTDNLTVTNDIYAPFNFRFYGIAVIATDVTSGDEKVIYVDTKSTYKTIYKKDINISFETVAGVDENFILSFTNTPQYL
jgi:hypothetical protein